MGWTQMLRRDAGAGDEVEWGGVKTAKTGATDDVG
jgi:hypothetical protein